MGIKLKLKENMIKQRSIIEVEVNGKEARFECASAFNWQEVIQALQIVNAIAVEKIEAIESQKKIKTPELPTTDEVKQEEINVD